MPDVIYEKKGRVAYITINRPERMNAMGSGVNAGLYSAFTDFRDDDNLSVAILTGAGERAFCSGADLKEAAERSREGGSLSSGWRGPGAIDFMNGTLEVWKPIIAAVNGYCLAGGLEIALACDIRIAAEHATFGLPEAKRSWAAPIGRVRLPRLIPLAWALQIGFTGDPIDAQTALRIGLVTKVVPLDQLMPEATKLAEVIAESAPLTVRGFKENAYKSLGVPLDVSLRMNFGPDIMGSEDAIEGARAFAEKRKAVWKGR